MPRITRCIRRPQHDIDQYVRRWRINVGFGSNAGSSIVSHSGPWFKHIPCLHCSSAHCVSMTTPPYTLRHLWSPHMCYPMRHCMGYTNGTDDECKSMVTDFYQNVNVSRLITNVQCKTKIPQNDWGILRLFWSPFDKLREYINYSAFSFSFGDSTFAGIWKPVPAGINLPIITFSFSPRK